jgi:hypothetical protein
MRSKRLPKFDRNSYPFIACIRLGVGLTLEGLVASEPDHERQLVDAFVTPTKRDRVRDLLAKPRRRRTILATLYHQAPLDPRYMTRIASSDQTPRRIEGLLRAKGAPDQCYAISTDSGLDGTTLLLREALDRVVGRGEAAILSCVPGQLGYFEAEEFGERYVLERRGSPTKG